MALFLRKNSISLFAAFLSLLLLGQQHVQAQCTNSSSFGSSTLPSTTGVFTLVTGIWASEYHPTSGAVVGRQYRIASTTAGDFLTIRSGTSTGAVVASGTSPVTFTASSTAQLFIHVNTNSSCATANISRNLTAEWLQSGGGGCSVGPVINVSSLPYSITGATTCGAGNDVLTTAVACGNSSLYLGGEDHVYVFTPTTTGSHTITMTSNSSWTGLILYAGCPASGGTCAGSATSSAANQTLTVTLTAGTQYYLVVDTWPSPTCIPSYNLSITPPASSTDPCTSISTLTCGTPATATLSGTGIWNFAGTFPTNSCGFSTLGQERIYSFTPTVTGMHTLQVTSSTGSYIDYLFKPASGGCNNTGWTCIDDISLTSTVTIGTLTAGVQYYLLLDAESTSSVTQTFQINCPSAGPVNDECASATTLTSGTTCVNTAGTTVGATQSLPAITCSSFTGTADDDVWYKFTAVATTHTVTVAGTGIFDAVVDVRSGACNGTNIGCADATTSGGTETVTVSGLTIGATYYVRVYSYSTSGSNGTFNICVTHTAFNPCASIATLTCGTPVTATPSGTGAWDVTTCGFSTPGQERIYSFTPTVTGTHSLQVTSSTGSYIDYFYKAASGGCSNTGWTCIDDISTAQTITFGPLTAGVQYYILLDPETTASVTQTFQINCPVPPDPCTSITPVSCATPVTASLGAVTGVWNSAFCGFSVPGGEKIYSFTPTVTGVHTLQVTSATGTFIDYGYKAASGGCSSTGWTCIDDILSAGTYTIGTLTAGVQYYILLDGESSSTASTQTFQINCPSPLPACVSAPTAPANGATVCGGTSVTLSWPSVSGATSYDVYFGTATSPPFVINTGSTSYTVSSPLPGTYYWQIIPKNAAGAASGCAVWSFTVQPEPTGNSLFNPIIVGSLPYSTTGNNLPANCWSSNYTGPNNQPSPDVFYRITTTACQSRLTISTCGSGFDTYIHVLNSVGTWIASDDNGGGCAPGTLSGLQLDNLPAGTYFIVVEGFSTISGNYSLNVTASDITPPTVTCPANITVGNTANQCLATVTFPAPTVSDNCPGATYSAVPASGSAFAVGFSTVVVTATDASGNTSSCTFNVVVNDTQAPTLQNCPGNQSVSVNASCQGVMPNYTAGVTVSDNCPGGIGPIVQSPAPNTTFTGTTVVTLSATDGALNVGTCSFSVVVADNTPPTIQCSVGTLNPAANASCQYVVANLTGFATAMDNCGTPTISQTPAIGTVLGLGASTVVLRATDSNGNSSTCSISLVVSDQTAPSITCPANQTVAVGAGCQAPLPSYIGAATASDNCTASPTITQTPAAGTAISPGTVTVTLRATDASGNSSSCTFSVLFNDQTPPTITCPASITQANTPGQCAANVTFASATASDNCLPPPTVTQTGGPASGTFFAVGTTTVTFRATDGVGNSSTCTFTVTVNDAQAPTITCPPGATVAANAACQAVLASYTAAATAADNCGVSGVTQLPVAGTTIGLGANTVTLRATDGAGNSSTCSLIVTVTDQTAPSITCPPNTTVSANASCQAVLGSYTAGATAGDNCTALPTITQQPAAATILTGHNTAQTVTLRATDAAGNSSSCTLLVTVVDQTAPTIICPPNTTVAANAACQAVLASYSASTSSDNCTPSPTITQLPAAGTTIGLGAATVTLRATDAAGNSSTCTLIVTVTDQTAPSITCPANISQGNATNQCGANVTFAAATASDNCAGSPTVTQIGGPASGAFFAVGTTTVTFRATDPAGNSVTCSFTVTVNDTQAPAITCPANITQPNAANQCGANVTYTAPVGTDNCSATTTQIGGQASGTFFPVGTTTNTFRAIDPAGNSTTCSFTVTVNDTQAPAITCPANITQPNTLNQCGRIVTFANATAADNCPTAPTVTQIAGLPSGSFFPVGASTITFRATDGAGNSATCSFVITINDTQAPAITCPANIVVNNTPNLCGAAVTYTTPVGTDNCSAVTTQTAGLASGAFYPVGITTNTFRATDPSGNTAQCSFTVRVNDVQAPTITCPAPQTVSTTGYTCAATASSVNLGLPITSDNCSVSGLPTNNAPASYPVGTTSVVWTVKDASNNTATCVQTVTVLDQQVPVIQCPTAPVTATADPSTCTAVVDFAVNAYDNCSSGVTVTYNHPPLSEFELNNTLVTATVTDASGNTNSCTFLVSVGRAEEVCNDVDDDCDGQVDESDEWNFNNRVLASDGVSNELYGSAVDIDGDYAIVGFKDKDSGGQTVGGAYVLLRTANGTWQQLVKLVPQGLEAGDSFGDAVAISGGWLAVGAPGDDDAGLNAGAVYVYRQDAVNPAQWTEFAKLVPANLQGGDNLGSGLALHGDYLLAGATGDDEAEAEAGAVYVFGRNQGGTNNWGLVKKLLAPFGATADEFGASIDYDGAHAVVAAPGDDQNGNNAGAAYVFGRNQGGPNTFGLVKKLVAGDGEGADNFGSDVAISGDFALVGASQQDDKGTNAGKVYAFYRNQFGVADSWGPQQGLLDANGKPGDNFGTAVAMEGEYAAISAPGADFPNIGQNAGKVVLYQRQQGGWVPVETLYDQQANGNDYFGRTLAMSGRTVLVGVPLDDAAFQPDRGSVVFFDGLCAEADSRTPASEGAATGDAATKVAVTAWPVPFSDVLNIRVGGILPSLGGAGGGPARVSVLNQLGQEVAVLHDGVLAGSPAREGLGETSAQFQWDARRFAAGLYYVRVQTDNGVETKAVTLAR